MQELKEKLFDFWAHVRCPQMGDFFNKRVEVNLHGLVSPAAPQGAEVHN